MKKLFISLLLMVFTGMMSSCALSIFLENPTDKAVNIQSGMSKTEVLNIMGKKADFRRFHEDFEEWEYRYTVSTDPLQADVVILHFVEGRVVSMDSFRDYPRTWPSRHPKPEPEKK